MLRHSATLLTMVLATVFSYAQMHVSFDNTADWTTSQLSKYVGQTVTFDQPVYTCNNYSGVTASMHRVMSPTNQVLPLSDEYDNIVTINNSSCFTLSGMSGYQRMGETIYGLTAKVNSTSSLTYVSSTKITGTRADMEAGIPDVDLVKDGDTIVKHDLLVCAANLEYYLVENLGTGYGPDNQTEHERQRTKVIAGLGKIAADIYGFVEIEQGQSALKELAQYLTSATGKHYTWIDDGGSASGSYTKSGYVYCSDVVKPYGELKNNNTAVTNRKKMQAFDVLGSGERFIFSLNHFKAKSGNGTGLDADQGDGQGIFNQTRVNEANSVLSSYASNKSYYGDNDVLIMGDLNAYAKEDPIMALVNGGMTDLHRYFHADSSYSYTFHGTAGYLDHALCNSTMLTQVTGMAAYHINSDESDSYTYDKSSDVTMFRYSDHDPVIVGLKMGAQFVTPSVDPTIDQVSIIFRDQRPVIGNAEGGYYVVAAADGRNIIRGSITSDEYTVLQDLPQGIYVINVYFNGEVKRAKYFVD